MEARSHLPLTMREAGQSGRSQRKAVFVSISKSLKRYERLFCRRVTARFKRSCVVLIAITLSIVLVMYSSLPEIGSPTSRSNLKEVVKVPETGARDGGIPSEVAVPGDQKVKPGNEKLKPGDQKVKPGDDSAAKTPEKGDQGGGNAGGVPKVVKTPDELEKRPKVLKPIDVDAEADNVEKGSSSIAVGQYSCANCGEYTKTSKCTRVRQLQTAKEVANEDLEKCNTYSAEERSWLTWLFTDKSVFEIIPPKTTTDLAPREIPESLRAEYTLGGRTIVKNAYYRQIYAGNKKRIIEWDEQFIDGIVGDIQAGNHSGSYSKREVQDIYGAFQKYTSFLGGHGVVIGSETPWIECAALAANSDTRITTYEYSKINSTHPRIQSVMPSEFAHKYANDKDFQPFDWAASFSSIEHSGLGRYGDPLNPWGDVQAMFRVSCMLKPGGLFFFGVPTSGGDDGLTWNAHRVYGKLRFRFMFENFRVVEATRPVFDAAHAGYAQNSGYVQNVLVLQNMRGCTNGNLDRF
eukprot:602982_1